MNRPRVAWAVAGVFGAFAFNYFLSALLRAVVATLAPEFARELQLGAADLGLLAGAYFLGFASMQLPLGWALDRYGARRVLLCFLVFAVLGCIGFALARNFGQLVVARLMIGLGVSASLMAPLAAFVHLYDRPLQLRLNSWMLMTGSLGMVASTLPVQALLPMVGWRGLFWMVAAALAVGMVGHCRRRPGRSAVPGRSAPTGAYRAILTHPVFVRSLPLGFFTYGGLIAVQSLVGRPLADTGGWPDGERSGTRPLPHQFDDAVRVSRLGRRDSAPAARGWSQERLIGRGWPAGALVLLCIVLLGPQAGAGWLALWCAFTSVIALSQPAVAQAFRKEQAGRALSAFNLAIFSGVFAWQWGMGLAIDAMVAAGWEGADSHRAAMALLLLGTTGAGLWYWLYPRVVTRRRSVVSTQR